MSETKPKWTPGPASMFENNLDIAIRCWARNRARQVKDAANRITPEDMEYFIANLLTDALKTFNEEYNRTSGEYILHLESVAKEALTLKPIAPVAIAKARGETNHE